MELQNLLFLLIYNCVFSNVKQVQAEVNCSLCLDYMVSGPRGVVGQRISASSSNMKECDGRRGRLHNKPCGWSAHQEDKNAFVQVTFSELKIVQGVITQGQHKKSEWVTSYSVAYSTDSISWSMAKTKNDSEIFQGNSDPTTTKINFFSECVEAKLVRILPKTWYGNCSLRFDVLGSTKLADVNTKWKRHSISLNANEIDRLSPISNVPSANQGVCGIKCYQQPKCLSYMFDSVRDNCEIYERQIFQGNIVDNDHLTRPIYFINTAFLQNHEYIIDETLNVCYKIHMWRSTSGQASKCCENGKANLISIRNSAVMKFLQKTVRTVRNSSKTVLFHVDGSYSNGTWSYRDGKGIPNTLWRDKEPKPSKDNLTCVALTPSGLSTVDCTERHGFICGV